LQHQHYDLGQVEAGRVVEVILGGAANVRIMDHSSYQEYRAERRHMFVGGFVTASSYRAAIPERGHWHVVLDLGGRSGHIRSTVRVLPGTLTVEDDDPPLRSSALASAPSLVLARGEKRPHDVFILHVPEDKAVVRAFAFALRKKGLKVTYDDYELAPGDSAHKKVNAGMGGSHFGVAVISRPFIMQGWVTGGVGDLAVRPLTGKQALMPLWHDITRGETLEFCPDIAGLVACHTGVSTYDEIADDIVALLKG
jgi:hypothetical protein